MNVNKALILVDIQNDFIPGGSLAVKDGDQVVSVANSLTDKFPLVIATMDWHPADHKSFAENNSGTKVGDLITLNGLEQVLWPVHCVQTTKGSELHPSLDISYIDYFISKGEDKEIDSYSAFFDNGKKRKTDLDYILNKHNVSDLCVMGLATDYCVKYTVLDALSLGYNVYLIEDGCRGVDLTTGDIERAIQEMKTAGAIIINSKDI